MAIPSNIGKMIGKGRTAEVFELKGNRIVKLFFKSYDSEKIQHEAKISQAAHDAGIPTPRLRA